MTEDGLDFSLLWSYMYCYCKLSPFHSPKLVLLQSSEDNLNVVGFLLFCCFSTVSQAVLIDENRLISHDLLVVTIDCVFQLPIASLCHCIIVCTLPSIQIHTFKRMSGSYDENITLYFRGILKTITSLNLIFKRMQCIHQY